MREGKGEYLIGHILTTKHQRSHRGSGGGIQIYETPVQALISLFPPPPPPPLPRQSLFAGYMQVQEASIDTQLLMRKVRKGKVLSNRIGVKESLD